MNTRFSLKVGAFLCASVMAANIASAGNVLQNPSFESTPVFATGSWTAHSPQSWSQAQSTVLVYPGDTDSLWMQGLYGPPNGGTPYYNMFVYQTVACAPGSTFTASAYFSQYVYQAGGDSLDGDDGDSGLFTSDASGNEEGWVEVMFLGANDTPLADYKSTIITPAYESLLVTNGDEVTNESNGNIYLAWLNCEVTNQYDVSTIGGYTASIDPTTETVTNTLGSGQYMVAPPGTEYVQYRVGIAQAYQESGASYWDNCSLDLVGGPGPSAIGNLSPDGSHFFNIASTNFTFTVTSAASGGATLPTNPTSGIGVTVNGQNKSADLQFSGTPTALNVALPNITSNQLYNISVTVTNSAGLISTASTSFDTFATNNFIVEVEDYDFNGGMFIQNPILTTTPNANSYWGTAGTEGIDIGWNPTVGSPVGDGGNSPTTYPDRTDDDIAFQQATDIQLPAYLAASNPAVYNVNLSYNVGGAWENYTRNPYPQGNYLVYARISGGAGYGVEYLNILTNGGYGTDDQATNELGQFTLPNGVDWSSYSWIPLTDSFGNLKVVNIPPGQQTLQLLSGGGENLIDFMFVPVTAGLPPAILNISPLSTQTVFVNAPNVTFTVTSSSSTIATNNVQTFLNGVNVSSSEVFTGNDTNWNVSVPIPSNQLLTMEINAADANGLSNSVTETFDTFSQNNFMIEADEWDFQGGQFIPNPIETGLIVDNIQEGETATNSYYLYPEGNSANAAIPGIDYSATNANAGETYLYRPLDLAGTQVATDFIRQKFINVNGDGITNTEFNLGWWNPGTWLNYTRIIPTNTYNVYGRLAGGGPYSGLLFSLVTNGVGTATQQLQLLGSFADPNADGYQTWHWIPMLNTNGQLVTVSLGGTNTFRATAGTGANALFYMLVPASIGPSAVKLTASVSGGMLHISFMTQNGHNYTVNWSASLGAGANWQPLEAAIAGNGSMQSVTDTLNNAQRFYQVVAQ
ncbi:MAG TPA: hypothetical protein VMH30_12945 [Verrucomicrobiae bacterium]|nr:hypothetical protein [Verrucomicrobiae bacterium]